MGLRIEPARFCEIASNIKVLNHRVNKGYGASLKTGICNAQYEIVVITDADGTYPNERIPELVNYIKDYDME